MRNRKQMRYIFTVFIILFISGCAAKKDPDSSKNIQNYFLCAEEKAIQMDDGFSNVGDLATAAIFACGEYEAKANPFREREYYNKYRSEVRRTLRENSFSRAVKSVTKNRRENSPNNK